MLATKLIHLDRHALAMSTDGAAMEHVSNSNVAKFSMTDKNGPASCDVVIEVPSRAKAKGTERLSFLGSDKISRVVRSFDSLVSSSLKDVQAAWIELISSL